MPARSWFLPFCAILAAGCSSPPPPKPPPPPEDAPAPPEPPGDPAPDDTRTRAPRSTASYDEVMATPEALDLHDSRVQLSDAQLTGPMRGALTGCRLPSNAKITIKTAVQNGRAIGVTVDVQFVHPPPSPSSRPPSKAQVKAQAKAEQKLQTKIVACVDRNVRGLSWPPSGRRDSFTTDF